MNPQTPRDVLGEALWDALDEVPVELPSHFDAGFERALERRQRLRLLRPISLIAISSLAIAAGALIAVQGAAPPSPALRGDELALVADLELVENLDLLQDLDVLLAWNGEAP